MPGILAAFARTVRMESMEYGWTTAVHVVSSTRFSMFFVFSLFVAVVNIILFILGTIIMFSLCATRRSFAAT